MKKTLSTIILTLLFVAQNIGQEVKPPYILGKNGERIKSKNFLAGKRPYYASKYQIYDDRKPGGASISFDKKTNEFDVVTGANNDNRSIRQAMQELRSAERMLLLVTGIASNDKCKIKVTVRIVIPGTTDGGLGYDHLPSCGGFN